MTITEIIIYYIVKIVSGVEHMSVPRCIKVIYLLDWYSAFMHQRPSGRKWFHGLCGPKEASIEVLLSTPSRYFEIRQMDNHFGGVKDVIYCKEVSDVPKITPTDMTIISDVASIVRGMPWNDFIRLVSSTYPMLKSLPGEYIDLKTLATGYSKRIKRTDGDVIK
jgi:hypothetical protein